MAVKPTPEQRPKLSSTKSKNAIEQKQAKKHMTLIERETGRTPKEWEAWHRENGGWNK